MLSSLDDKQSISEWLEKVLILLRPYGVEVTEAALQELKASKQYIDSEVNSATFVYCWIGSDGSSHCHCEVRKENSIMLYSMTFDEWMRQRPNSSELEFHDFLSSTPEEICRAIIGYVTPETYNNSSFGQALFEISDGVLLKYCGSEHKVNIPEGVETISSHAFDQYHGIGKGKLHNRMLEISFPDTLMEIERLAFFECTELTVSRWSKNLTVIGEEAFLGCKLLDNVELPESLRIIGKEAFRRCKGIKSIAIGKNVTQIGDQAFQDAAAVEEISLYADIPVFGKDVFKKCIGVNHITLHKRSQSSKAVEKAVKKLKCDITEIETDAADNGAIANRSSVIIDGREYVETYCSDYCIVNGYLIAYCGEFENIVLPKDVHKIFKYAFADNQVLNNVYIPDGYISIGEGAFSGCANLRTVRVPGTVKAVKNLFWDTPTLETVVFEEGVESISNSFIRSGIIGIVIPSTVHKMPEFSHCNNLTDFVIPEGITEIPRFAFEHCPNLKKVTIPRSAVEIPEGPITYCAVLELAISPDNSVYHCAGNCLINTESGELITGCNNSIIPDNGSVTSIGRHAFRGCAEMETISIPASVRMVGINAFADCAKLKKVISYRLPLPFENNALSSAFDMKKLQSGELVICGPEKA